MTRGQLAEIPLEANINYLAVSIRAILDFRGSKPDFLAVNYAARNSGVVRALRRISGNLLLCWTVYRLEAYAECRKIEANAIFECFVPDLEGI